MVHGWFQRIDWREFKAVVLLPVIPTIVGVYAALMLENRQRKSEDNEKTAAIVRIVSTECVQLNTVLESLSLRVQPGALPTITLTSINLLQQPQILSSLPIADFRILVSSLNAMRQSNDEYSRLLNDYRSTENRPLPQFAPPMLPIPTGPAVKIPTTKDEADQMFANAQKNLSGLKNEDLEARKVRLGEQARSYQLSVSDFCKSLEKLGS